MKIRNMVSLIYSLKFPPQLHTKQMLFPCQRLTPLLTQKHNRSARNKPQKSWDSVLWSD